MYFAMFKSDFNVNSTFNCRMYIKDLYSTIHSLIYSLRLVFNSAYLLAFAILRLESNIKVLIQVSRYLRVIKEIGAD